MPEVVRSKIQGRQRHRKLRTLGAVPVGCKKQTGWKNAAGKTASSSETSSREIRPVSGKNYSGRSEHPQRRRDKISCCGNDQRPRRLHDRRQMQQLGIFKIESWVDLPRLHEKD